MVIKAEPTSVSISVLVKFLSIELFRVVAYFYCIVTISPGLPVGNKYPEILHAGRTSWLAVVPFVVYVDECI